LPRKLSTKSLQHRLVTQENPPGRILIKLTKWMKKDTMTGERENTALLPLKSKKKKKLRSYMEGSTTLPTSYEGHLFPAAKESRFFQPLSYIFKQRQISNKDKCPTDCKTTPYSGSRSAHRFLFLFLLLFLLLFIIVQEQSLKKSAQRIQVCLSV